MSLSDALQKLTIRINRSGSGILFLHPNDANRYYIFTAHHCVEQNKAFCLVEYECEPGVFKNTVIPKDSILTDPKSDFALLLVNKSDFDLSAYSIPQVSISRLAEEDSLLHFRGYPTAFDGKAAKLEAKFIENRPQGFKIRTTTNLNDTSGDLASGYMAGLSGSGVVYEQDNDILLVGIVTHLGNSAASFNQLECSGFSMINPFLDRYNLPLLDFDEDHSIENTSETLYSSLLKVSLPTHVYIAQINITREELFDYARKEEKYVPYKMDNRQFVYELLKMKGLRLSGDFAVFSKYLVTFYDLSASDNSFHNIVDQGTVDRIPIAEFYQDPDRRPTFVNLLNNCLSRKLHHMMVDWKSEDSTFIFKPSDEALTKRKIAWKGKVKSERTVFEAKMYPKNNPDEPDRLWYCVHFGFQRQFKLFGQDWYLNLIPDDYATYDGKRKHFWKTQDLSAYKKKKERNEQVYTHVRFLAYFLKQNRDFFVNFDDLVSFENAPVLPDEYWHVKKEKKEKKEKKGKQ